MNTKNDTQKGKKNLTYAQQCNISTKSDMCTKVSLEGFSANSKVLLRLLEIRAGFQRAPKFSAGDEEGKARRGRGARCAAPTGRGRGSVGQTAAAQKRRVQQQNCVLPDHADTRGASLFCGLTSEFRPADCFTSPVCWWIIYYYEQPANSLLSSSDNYVGSILKSKNSLALWFSLTL